MNPRSSRTSTTGPCGTSTATATALALPVIERIQSASSDRPCRYVGTLVPLRCRPEHRAGRPDASLTPSRHQQTRRLSPQPSYPPQYYARAAMTAADPCTGARWRDFLLGIRRGQPVGAHVPSWCSRHGVDGWSLPTGGPAWLTYDFCLPDAADGTGWTPPTASVCQGDAHARQHPLHAPGRRASRCPNRSC